MRHLAAFVGIVLTACQPVYLKDGTPNENSPHFDVPVDSRLVLNRELTVPQHQRYLYFQHGRAMNFQDVNQYLPYCAIELHTKRSTPQSIKPDTFAIHKVDRRYQYSLARAALEVAQIRDRGNGDPWSVIATLLELSSEKQQDVIRLVCAHWGVPQNMSYLTVADIRRSLGELFTLQLAQPGAKPPAPARRERERPGY